ncbi:hypothetical protein L2E82_06173 [Cichorium intybus]|uniref:Uncharacterized protein n=1 Tax=Cichorium intybus TaxID=13427 RepID=A0ACB9HA12_CICIN|nr:hypothetical protein L2E82_06173 [Cichorium intybus]
MVLYVSVGLNSCSRLQTAVTTSCPRLVVPASSCRPPTSFCCKEFSPTNNTRCNRRLYIASCLRLSVPVRSCRTQISLSISI